MTPHDAIKGEVGVRELHDQLSRYVQQVAAGHEVIVTSRGRRVARLSPIDVADPLASLRARGLVSDPQSAWMPRADRPAVREPLDDVVLEQRR